MCHIVGDLWLGFHKGRTRMRHFLSLVSAASLLGLVVTSASADVVNSSYEFVNYDGSTLPDAGTPAWSRIVTGSNPSSTSPYPGNVQVLSSSIFELDTQTPNTGNTHRYARSVDLAPGSLRLDRGGSGYVLEISLQVVSSERTMATAGNRIDGAFNIAVTDIKNGSADNGSGYFIGIDREAVAIAHTSGADNTIIADQRVALNTVAGYNANQQNVFTFVRANESMTIYVNGQQVKTIATLPTAAIASGKSWIEFGDRITSRDGKYQIDYLKAGAVVIPEPAAAGLLGVGGALVLMRRK